MALCTVGMKVVAWLASVDLTLVVVSQELAAAVADVVGVVEVEVSAVQLSNRR